MFQLNKTKRLGASHFFSIISHYHLSVVRSNIKNPFIINRMYAKDVFLDDPNWDTFNLDTKHEDTSLDNVFIEEAQLHSFMENYVKAHKDTPTHAKERKYNDMRRSVLHNKIYSLEKIGSKSERIYRWLAECVRLSRENKEYLQAILYCDRIIERFIKEFGETSVQVGNARMEKAKLLAIIQDWSGCLSEICHVLQCHSSKDIQSILSIDRLASIFLAEFVSRQMPSSFKIPWAPTFHWRLEDDRKNDNKNDNKPNNNFDNKIIKYDAQNIFIQPEDGIQYLPPFDQWCNIILDHLKFTVKEIGFQQYKPYILRNAAWMISRQVSDFGSKSDKIFEQLEPSAYIDLINKEENLSEKAIKDIQFAIKHFTSVSQYYQKKKASPSLLGDIEYDIAFSHYRINQLEEAIKSCQKAISFYNEAGNATLDIARSCHLLTLCLWKVDKNQANLIIESSLDMMEKTDSTYNIEYIQYVYTYLRICDKVTEKHKVRLNRCQNHLSELKNSDILDYFMRLPIAITEWNDICVDISLMKRRFDEIEILFEQS